MACIPIALQNSCDLATHSDNIFKQKAANFWRNEDVEYGIAPTLSAISNGLGRRLYHISFSQINYICPLIRDVHATPLISIAQN